MMSPDEPLLREVYVFGDLLDGADPVDYVSLALVLDLPPEKLPWASQPRETARLIDILRLDKGGFGYWWRPRHAPVWNHHIRGPVRFWSLEGPDDVVLRALAERRFDDLPRSVACPAELRSRVATELDVALAQLRAVREAYWEREWRREHRGGGRYPENRMWEAVDGYLDLLDAAGNPPGDGAATTSAP